MHDEHELHTNKTGMGLKHSHKVLNQQWSPPNPSYHPVFRVTLVKLNPFFVTYILMIRLFIE